MAEDIVVVAIAEAKEGYESRAEAAIRVCVEQSRKEPGCRLYTAHVEAAEPWRFVFIERWASQEALSLHAKTPHFLALGKAFEECLRAPPRIHVLNELR